MNSKLLSDLKEKLAKEKAIIEKNLKRFAEKDKKLPDDWDTKFPKWNGESGSSAMETAADEVEEYANRLPIEYNLELKLRDINLALKKMKAKKYGICEKCKKAISQARLKISPETRFCKKCHK